ncbi:MAG TPA: hypothetical protein VK659_23515 [Asanoa sp.]|nr:hypothetical protein [Asanoa sp.]
MLFVAGATTSAQGLVFPLFLAGAGIGFFVQVSLLAGQNAVALVARLLQERRWRARAALFGTILAAQLPTDVAGAFHSVFRWTVPFMVVALLLGVLMREKPLSDEMIEITQGKAEAPEY